jgi:DNA end-binding protein Ku
MRAKDVVGMGRVVLARRERPIIVEPMGNGIRGITLRYSHEIRDEASYFAEIPNLKLPEEMLRVAEHIVETKMSDFNPAFLEDRYRTVLISKLKERSEMPKKATPAAPSAQNVISLMDVLKRSLAAEQPVARTSPPKTAPRRAAAPSRGSPKRSSARARKTG